MGNLFFDWYSPNASLISVKAGAISAVSRHIISCPSWFAEVSLPNPKVYFINKLLHFLKRKVF